MFDDTNGYGDIPDALHSSYGYADSAPSSVRRNMETAISTNPFNTMNQMVAANPAQPSVQGVLGGMAAGNIPMRVVASSATQARNAPMARAATGPRPSSSGYGAASTSSTYPTKPGLGGKLFREYKGQGGYVYAQYEDGSYAILNDGYNTETKKRGGMPSGTKMNVPFTDRENARAFNAIRAEVETAIGPYTSLPTPAPAQAASGSGGGGFTPSNVDTTEKVPASNTSWMQQSTLGLPHWGWLAGVTVAAAGAGYWYYDRSKRAPARAAQ